MSNTVETIKSVLSWIDKMPNCHSIKWEIEQLLDMKDELFQHSKFKVGQYVQIISELNITESHCHGWFGFKQQLVVGAIGQITDVDWSKGRGFSYAVKFPFSESSFANFDENQLRHVV